MKIEQQAQTRAFLIQSFGSVRVCYIDFVVKERIYLITAYPKNKKENLSKEECNEIKKLVKLLEESL